MSCTTATATLIPWDTEQEDNDSMHSTGTNPSRVIAQTLGMFTVHHNVRWTSGVTSGKLLTNNLRLNSAGSSAGGSTITTYTELATGGLYVIERTLQYRMVNIGDYWELFATQAQGSTQTTDGTGAQVTGFAALWEIA